MYLYGTFFHFKAIVTVPRTFQNILDFPLEVYHVVVANAPAGDVGREEVREGEGGAQEGEKEGTERRKRATSSGRSHMSPSERSVGLAGQLKRCGTE